MHSICSISARRTSMRPARHALDRTGAGGKSAGSTLHEVAGRDVGQLVEPERGDGREHPALVGHGLGHHHVEDGDAVGRDHQQVPSPAS